MPTSSASRTAASQEPPRPPCAIRTARKWAIRQLRDSTDSPGLEAELLLAELLGKTRVYILAYPEVVLSEGVLRTYIVQVRRRVQGKPLPYITGHIEFFALDFEVTPAVLIPRPETELLVETALDWMATHAATTAVDVGTGSGCIAIALATHAPALCCVAIDLSPAALAVARRNALRHGVADRITLVQGDLLAPLAGPVELIVSNPPYIAEDEWDALPLSVRQEPRLALLSGAEGLDAIRRLLEQARVCLRSGGLLVVEIGERQGAAVRALAKAIFPGAEVAVRADLAGKDRLVQVQAA